MSSALADGWPQLCSLVTARLSRSGPGKSANWTNWPGHLFDTLLARRAGTVERVAKLCVYRMGSTLNPREEQNERW